jgi:hypothetical protein
MKMIKRFLLSLGALVALATSALAQIASVPQVGLTTGYLAKATYSSAFFGFVPFTGGTDEICISGSASKVVRINRISLGGTASAIVNLPVTILRRASLDTGGTPATTTANPGVTTQIASRDTGQAPNTAATAVLVSYTAAPTIVDSAPVYLDSGTMVLSLTGTGAGIGNLIFDWSRDIENNAQVPTLRGAAQQICVNFNGTTPGTALLNGSIAWTEE